MKPVWARCCAAFLLLVLCAPAQGQSLYSLISTHPNLVNFTRSIAAVPEVVALLTSSSGPLTVFAPHDSVLPDWQLLDRDQLLSWMVPQRLLTTHAVSQAFYSTVLADSSRTPALDVRISGGVMSLNTGLASAPTVCTVTTGNLAATNGVVHILNEVPLAAAPLTESLDGFGLSVFYDLLDRADLMTEFDAEQDVTLFAPTNAALNFAQDYNPFRFSIYGDLNDVLYDHLFYGVLFDIDINSTAGVNITSVLGTPHFLVRHDATRFSLDGINSTLVLNGLTNRGVLHVIDGVLGDNSLPPEADTSYKWGIYIFLVVVAVMVPLVFWLRID